MAEYIERDAAKEAVCTIILHDGIRDALKSCIDDVQAADVRPVVRGRWIISRVEYGWNCAEHPTHCKCSKCQREVPFFDSDNYCPNCGADMRGDAAIAALLEENDG